MTGTLSPMTTWALLPILRRIWARASAEPMASPSGRACDVTRKRRRCSISCKTFSSWSMACFHVVVQFIGSSLRDERLLFSALLDSAQNVIDPGTVFLRSVEHKIQIRHVAHSQAHQQFMPDITFGGIDGLDRLLRLAIVACNCNKDAGALAIR